MNAMSKGSSSGGCGCGGAGSKGGGCGCGSPPTGLCACGDAGCATCQNQGFVRPLFFAGQLLTEEDLQKLMDYVVGKNRLHNQRLWGDGVVCGLDVSCNPCGGGTVIVNPGYALDCCGNDLLLGCSQELDINAMVRDLKRNLLGGYDCGDPCADKKNGKKARDEAARRDQAAAALSVATPYSDVIANPNEDQEEEKPPDNTRHYCLYIRYCETPTDPVSPYATDEGCSLQSCQPTRISEGVRFELRCDERCDHQSDIRDRICECLGDPESVYQSSRSANYFSAIGRLTAPVREVKAVAAAGESIELAELRQASENFLKSAEVLKSRRPLPQAAVSEDFSTGEIRHSLAQPSGDATDFSRSPQTAFSMAEFDSTIQQIRDATLYLARYYIARDKTRRTNLESAAGIPTEDQIQKTKSEILPVVNAALQQIEILSVPEQERAMYVTLLKRSEALLAGNEPSDEIGQEALQQTARGFLVNSSDLLPSARALAALREELLDRLDRSPRFGDCRLRADVLALRIPDDNTTESGWYNASVIVSKAWLRYLKDCFCAALNPPCGPCDDPAVLLACLEVKDCEVSSICNTKRKFVLSPTALRYWLPPLNELGEEIERLCCPETICPEDETEASEPKGHVLGLQLYDRYRQVPPKRFNLGIFQALCGTKKRGSYLSTAYAQQELGAVQRLRASQSTFFEQLISWMAPELGRTTLVTTATQQFGKSGLIDALNERETRLGVMAALASEFRSEVASSLRSEEVKAGLRTLVTELTPQPADDAVINKRFADISAAISKENLNESVAEALKTVAGPTGDALASIADDKVAAAIDKLKLASAVKDLKDLKRIKTENAELKKSFAAMEARLKRLEGGSPQ